MNFQKLKGSGLIDTILWSHRYDTMVSTFKLFRENVSLKVEQEFGMKKKDGNLTGCYRSIRDNESDFSLIPHDHPTIDYDKVDPYQVLGELSLSMLSGYHSNAEADVSFNDFILTSMKSFDRQTWFAVLAMASAFFGLWMTKRALFPDTENVALTWDRSEVVRFFSSESMCNQ